MEIHEAILHRIIKDRGAMATTQLREKPLEINEKLVALLEVVLKTYNNKSSVSYGQFKTGETELFPSLLTNYTSPNPEKESFHSFSRNIVDLIVSRMNQAPASTGGYVFIIRYTRGDSDYFLVAMLKIAGKVNISENLDIIESPMLDVDNLHEAARIDITKWQGDKQSYLSFVHKRNQGEATQYFRAALSCDETTDSQHHTDEMMRAVRNFCDHKKYDVDRTQLTRQREHDYCEEMHKNKEPVNLDILSRRLFEEDPAEFISFLRENDYAVAEEFKPYRKLYMRLKTVSYQSSDLMLRFNVSLLGGQIILHHRDDGTITSLTINDLPDSIVQQINENEAR